MALCTPPHAGSGLRTKQLLRIMKLTAILLIAACLQVSAKGYSQVTLSENNVSLQKVFKEIKKQTGYNFLGQEELLKNAGTVTVSLRNVSLQQAVEAILKEKMLTYEIIGKTVVIRKKIGPWPAPAEGSPALILFLRGRVTNEKQEPVAGATVTVKGTSNATATDNNGRYVLRNVDNNATLVITGVSIETREVKVNNRNEVNAMVKIVVQDIEETVIVAYGTTTHRKNVAAVTVVKGDDITNLPNRSFERSLQGQVPGLLITSGNGQPGGGASNVLLRGIATAFGGGARLPLFVIDGVPVTQDMTQSSIPAGSTAVTNPLAQINLNDIESYTVLKDATAVSLYGSKASNGVILLTTKKGRAGRTIVKLHQQVDIASLIQNRQPDVLNKEEYLELLRESYKNANPVVWTDAAIETDLRKKFPRYAKAPGDTLFYDAADWAGALNNNTAITSSTDLSISGGNDRSVFYLGMSYLDQTGIVKSSGYKRAAVRFNFSNKPASWITVGLNSSFSFNKQQTPSTGESSTGPFGFQHIVPAVYPIYLQNAAYYLPSTTSTAYNLANPAAALEWNVNRNTAYRAIGDLYVEINFLKRFKFKTDFGGDFMLTQAKNKTDMRLPSSTLQGIGEVTASDRVRTRIISTNTLRYNNVFDGKHFVEIALGHEAQSIFANSTSATSRGFSAPYFEEVSAGSTIVGGAFGTGGSSSKETQLSFFSQANYNYSNKYFASASIRRDGSSKFGSNNRFGNYWSLGAGWLISEEAFMQSTADWLTLLKIRGSLGTAGNAASLNATSRYYLLTLGGNYDGAVGASLAFTPGNANIRWEKQFSKDIGLEFRLFKNRVGATIDFYDRLNSDLIYLVNLPGNTGYSFGYDNIGDMSNKGIEISINADIVRSKNFKWNINVNWSTNQNKLEKAYQDSRILGNLLQKVGEPFNSMYLVRWAGVNPDNGKPQWYDINGKVTGTYSLADRVIVGQIQPKGFGGITNNFSYSGWQLSAFFYYQYGHLLYDDATATLMNDGATPYYNQSKEALNRWQKPGDQASNPRRVLSNPDGGNRASTRYVTKGDFIRLKNISLSYNFSSAILENLHISNIRVYAQGNNLALWTKYKGLDPENVTADGNTQFPYPQVKTFSLGVDLTF